MQLSLLAPRWSLPAAKPSIDFTDPFKEQTFAMSTPWTGAVTGVDVETYINFFCVCFKNFETGDRCAFEHSERCQLNKVGLTSMMTKNTIVSFNGQAYDVPLIRLAVRGADNIKLKEISDQIIQRGDARGWQIERELGLGPARGFDHIDLIESNPSVHQGLKMLNARLHGRFMVDLPITPAAFLSHDEMDQITNYCHNDLDATELVWKAMAAPLELRVALSAKYHVDMRSKSDAQIGEAIVKIGCEKLTGKKTTRAPEMTSFKYEVPDFLQFEHTQLQEILRRLRATTFFVSQGKVQTPPVLEKQIVKIGKTDYSMGLGGLHSMEGTRALISGASQLIDIDMGSQYPKIILRLGLVPEALGKPFLRVYGDLVRERLAAKAAGNKAIADGLKIGVNGVFGKLLSAYGVLSAHHLGIAVTLTGQLSILMLIEWLEKAGIPVVSANTDGVLVYCPLQHLDKMSELLKKWESIMDMEAEQVRYRAIYNSSVNSYIAVKEDGKCKRKGPLADPWSEGDFRGMMGKNPQMTVCSEALMCYVRDGTPVDQTITRCRDPRMFLTAIRVATGGLWRGHHLGRIVRYYWSTDGDNITYENGRKVAKTDGARPLLELTDQVPPDVDYLRYCEETARLAADYGVRL